MFERQASLFRLPRNLYFPCSHRHLLSRVLIAASIGAATYLPTIACLVAPQRVAAFAHALKADAPPVKVTEDGNKFILDNGTVILEISKERSQITSIQYRHNGKATELSKTMYFSSAASPTDPNAPRPPKGSIGTPQGRPNRLLQRGPDVAEVVMENGPSPTYPFHTETHYLLPRGESGFYAYQIYSHPADQPGGSVGEARFVIKGPQGPSLFDTHVVDAQRMAPYNTSPVVRQVSDATFLLEDGKIYTKYDNSAFMGDHYFHGMTGHGVGLWMINASNEYVNGGPLKQELTVHYDNTLLNMLEGGHYGGSAITCGDREAYTKFYGPFLVYMNSGKDTQAMFRDAERRTEQEKGKWPYAWVNHPEYPLNRGTVTGQIKLSPTIQQPRNATPPTVAGAWAILAEPGGNWPLQARNYQFWTKVGTDGKFTIPKVRPGTYTLYVCGGNQFEQYIQNEIKVEAGRTNDLGPLTWKPVTHGKMLWQIGVADRATTEFHDGNNVRHYANYLRYAKDFPDDVIFTIGKGREQTDWNFAQWTWYSKRPYWTIRFDGTDRFANSNGKATLTLGIAATNPLRGRHTNLQIRVNGHEVQVLHLEKSGAAAYRSGGQDSLYRVEYVQFPANLLKSGQNEITLGHTDATQLPDEEEQKRGQVGCIMYDAIRLEVETH